MNLEERAKKTEEILERIRERLNHAESETKKLDCEMMTKKELKELSSEMVTKEELKELKSEVVTKEDLEKLSPEMVTKREADKLWNVSWIMLGSIWTTLLIVVINIIFGK